MTEQMMQQHTAFALPAQQDFWYDPEALKNYQAAMSAMYSWPRFDYAQFGLQAPFQAAASLGQHPQLTMEQQQQQQQAAFGSVQQQQQQTGAGRAEAGTQLTMAQQQELAARHAQAAVDYRQQEREAAVNAEAQQQQQQATGSSPDSAQAQAQTPLDNTQTNTTAGSGHESDQSDLKLENSCSTSNSSNQSASLPRSTPSPSLASQTQQASPAGNESNGQDNSNIISAAAAGLPFDMSGLNPQFTSTPQQPAAMSQFAPLQHSRTTTTASSSPAAGQQQQNIFAMGGGSQMSSAFSELAESHSGHSLSGDGQPPRKKKACPVPTQMKDETYWERRRRNNESARRSRESRRQKEEQIHMRLLCLEQENLQLRTQLSMERAETDRMRVMLYNAQQQLQQHAQAAAC